MAILDLLGVGLALGKKLVSKLGPAKEIVESLTDGSPEKLALKAELARIELEIETAALEADKVVALASLDAEKALAQANADRAIAEIQSDDAYTRRWRPTLGYLLAAGLAFNLVAIPLLALTNVGVDLPPPDDTLLGITASLLGVKVIARSWEKRAKTLANAGGD